MGKCKKSSGIKLLMMVGIASLYATEALAVTAASDASVQGIIDFLKDVVIQNMAYVAGFCAFIIAAIAAVGNKVGPIIVDNIGKIIYFAFGGGVLTYMLGAAGSILG